ncbi:MAG: DUF433 domain-containing protein [Bacteroidota bacterium]|nr:DUF433 domain-containing protein [Bacteroidota bacterium]
MNFENILAIGNGIYTVPDVANILRLPYHKVNTWLNEYWDGKLGKAFKGKYSWRIDSTRAVGFHTLVEFYVMMQFSEAGVKPAQVLKAHSELSKSHNTFFPFAQKQIIENISTDGKRIYLDINGTVITLDGSRQFNLDFIKLFFKKIEFDKELLATRLWPLGKDKAVVCDPQHKFGQPIIDGTNIQTEAVYKMYLAKEPIPFIASLYELSEAKIKDAINYHKKAA